MLVPVILVNAMSIIIKTMAESQALIGRMPSAAGASRFKVPVGLCRYGPSGKGESKVSWTLLARCGGMVADDLLVVKGGS